MNTVLLLEAYREYLLARGFSPRVVKEYPASVRHFLAHVEASEGRLDIRLFSRAHVEDYHGALLVRPSNRKRPLGASTRLLRLLHVRSFFRFLHLTGRIAWDPTAALLLPKASKPLPAHLLTEEEAGRLLLAVNLKDPLGVRDRALLELLYGSGLRVSEALGLTLSDVDLGGEALVVMGKGQRQELVPVLGEAKRAMDHYLHFARPKLLRRGEAAEVVFLSLRGRPLHAIDVAARIRVYAQKAGLSQRPTPHSFRHSCATHLLKAGADIRFIQRLLRHKSISTTQVYTRLDLRDVQEALRKYHPRERDTNE